MSKYFLRSRFYFFIILVLIFSIFFFNTNFSLQIEKNKQLDSTKAFIHSISNSRYSYSETDELDIASIVLNHFFLHDTIVTELEISYLGTGSQNASEEHISVAGEITGILIEGGSGTYPFQLEYNELINQSDIYFTINETIPKGQYFIMELYWEQQILTESPSTHNISVFWYKQIGISAMKVVLSPGYSYVSATNTPDHVKPEENELILRWTEIFKEAFECALQTLYQEPYFEEAVIIDPLEISFFESINKLVLFTINIENTGNSTLQIEILSGTDIHLLNSSNVLIKPLEKNVYAFEGNLTNKNDLKSNITIKIKYFNGTQDIFEIPVNISIDKTADFVLFFFIIIVLILFLISSIYIYRNQERIKKEIKKKRVRKVINEVNNNDYSELQEKSLIKDSLDQTMQTEITDIAEKSSIPEILNKYKDKLKEKEITVFEILLKNPFGHSQAELTDLTGISKATMSRIVSQLEFYKLITREKSGMSKIVKVNDKFIK